MLLKNVKVLRPKDTKIQTKGNYRYVYKVTGHRYLKDKKYTIDERKVIGRMIDDEYMIPNEYFGTFYPDITMDIEDISDISYTLKVGNYVLIDKIFKDSGLDDLLDSVFPQYHNFIKDLAFYMIVREDSTIQHFPSFFFDHPSFSKKAYSDSFISKIFKDGFDEEDVDTFLKAWANMHNDDTRFYISYDSTNMTTDAKGIELARFGHAKSNEDAPQVNISYALRHKDTLPLMYELYDGSIIDNSECRYIIMKAKEYGLKNIGFILDRGYFSKKNMDMMVKEGYDFILAIKESTMIVKDAIASDGLSLKLDNKWFISDLDVYGKTIKTKIYGHDVYLHLYYDNIRAQKERNAYLKSVDDLEKTLNKHLENKKDRKEDLKGFDKKFYLRYDNNGYFTSYKRKEDKINKVTDSLGFFALVSCKKMSAKEALSDYRDRDVVEKMFRSLKTYLDYDSLAVHYDTSVKSKTFIVFVASIIRSIIWNNIKALYTKDKKNFTIPASIRELEKVEVTKGQSGIYRRTSALNAKNKKVLSTFDIDESHIDKASRKYTKNI